MKQIVVLSGKGGSGKTSIAAALAHLASREASIAMVDADVDAANLELLLSPEKLETHPFMGGRVASIDRQRCTDCGTCLATCRFEAVNRDEQGVYVDPVACEGCASCHYQCPAKAIRMEDEMAGLWYRSNTRFGPMFHAYLYPAAENSGRLVTLLKERARQLAREQGSDYLIVDGPPGIGCPVIASCAGGDVALLVTEPTAAGAHDLRRILDTVRHFRTPAMVAINKCDLNPLRRQEIEDYCRSEDVPVVALIPFDTSVTEAMVRGRAVTEEPGCSLSTELEKLWLRLR